MIPILVIHNPNNLERGEHVKKQFASQEGDFKYELVEAVMNPPQPSVGIMRSFKKCIQQARYNGWTEVMIVEDDILFLSPNSVTEFILLWRMWETKPMLLAGLYDGKIEPIKLKLYKEELALRGIARAKGKISGLHMGIYDWSIYDLILKAEEPYHLDSWLSTVVKIPISVAYPFLAVQEDRLSKNPNQNTKYLHTRYHLTGYPEPKV